MSKKILVTGGCGYIGSHTVRELQHQGYEVIVFDNLVHGHLAAVENAPVIVGDLLNPDEIRQVFAEYDDIAGVIHFAAYIENGESMEKPGKYFQNNVQGCVNLLDAMTEVGVSTLAFSSTCALYGSPEQVPVSETEPLKPESPYAASKKMAEEVIQWYRQLKGLRFANLRYFNAAGASFDAHIGHAYKPATHLITVAIEYILGQRQRFFINGKDYDTPDGTCVRDYIHVDDLATAHIAALEHLWKGGESMCFNLGTGIGVSNLETVKLVQEISGHSFEIMYSARRPGDLPYIWADNSRAREVLGWEPRYGLQEIVETAWRWHSTHPQGFATPVTE
ncbi:MAG: UDP-glucose 4-epimerase GalE [Caldilineales bacterium]|nr:UDP-glucose 4-epimerase GalE [Caldilineales bacterium]